MKKSMTKKRKVSSPKKLLTEFEKRCAFLKVLGVDFRLAHEYRTNSEHPNQIREPHDLELFESFNPNFSPYEWVSLCQNEGQFYIGGCCANTSHVQDRLNNIFRSDSGWFSVREFAEEISEPMASHDSPCQEGEIDFERVYDGKSLEKIVQKWARAIKQLKKPRKEGRKVIHVWTLLAIIWHIVKDFYSPERALPDKNPKLSDVDYAVSVLSRNLFSLAWNRATENNMPDHFAGQAKLNRLITVARTLPHLKTLNENLAHLTPPFIDGFALVDPAAPDVVLENRRGFCIFGSEQEAKELLDLWEKADAQHMEKKTDKIDYKLRPVRVSLLNGIEFVADDTAVSEIIKDVIIKRDALISKYNFRVIWSDDDSEYVGLCDEFSSMSFLASTRDEALSGIIDSVSFVVGDILAAGELPPAPMAIKHVPREIPVDFIRHWLIDPKLVPSKYTKLAEDGVSLSLSIEDLRELIASYDVAFMHSPPNNSIGTALWLDAPKGHFRIR